MVGLRGRWGRRIEENKAGSSKKEMIKGVLILMFSEERRLIPPGAGLRLLLDCLGSFISGNFSQNRCGQKAIRRTVTLYSRA